MSTLKPWKKLNSKIVFEHPWLTVYEDSIELPDGTKDVYIHFGSKAKTSSVAIIAIRNDGKILMQKELSYPIGEFLWQWPGGGTEAGETIEQSANRELMEEAGYRADSIELLQEMHVNNRRSANRQAVVVARQLRAASLPADTGEAFEHHWMSEAEIDSLIKQGEISHAHFLAGWTLYKLKK